MASLSRLGEILAGEHHGSVTEASGGRALPRPADDAGREPLELPEIVVARRQDDVLGAGGFEVADALDDLACSSYSESAP